ncbi:MAG: hypothetical protein OQK48_04485 [Sulfurimonas sp.]|uniref:hypothetical protein n=1 Tax=Sulfurimonas sp. TaxID=2022749 RepID=UPI002628211C|nr:hypothetical protein [Sulfurimonas sp.]MCW8895991.1 hypothetical protein [Sulfurimonas sp.]MCW8954179.1 hypothetical protein [Sulfurimonas sp.]MCW9067000.1 hypothetical protein [Sulfurimonas sp.]
MFLLSYIFIAVVIIYIGLAIYLYKLAIKYFPHKKSISKLVLAFFILLPTYDIIITNILGGYYCLTTPSTYISKKVEYPESIYWEDNVYPGFNEEDRKLMIKNYLDGVHLKTMALNGDDEKVYVYVRDVPVQKYNEINTKLLLETKKYNQINKQFTKELLKENEALWLELRDKFNEARKIVDEIEKQQNSLIDSCSVKEKVFTKQTMPKLNYTVTFNEVKLNFFSRNFLYSDVTKITDNSANEVIAQNQRVMKLHYNIIPAMSTYYDQESMCGDGLYFERNVMQMGGLYRTRNHKIWLNEKLYKKYIKGEK